MNPPVITSAATATGKQGQPFSYTITASESPTSYGATGLPNGVSVSTTTGVISGTPTASGTFTVALAATNPYGTGNRMLTMTVTSSVPVVDSAFTASGKQGQPLNYNITASESPTSYGATGLPTGVSVNTTTGLISGIPTVDGTFTVTLGATNNWGTGSKTLTLTVASSVPVVSSAATASGKQGQAFTYNITASDSPTSYGATGLPTGLSVNTTTGAVSGTPAVNGTFTVALSATNTWGSGSKTLTLTIASSIPVVSSAGTASGKKGQAFSYTITASDAPTSFGATGLPNGVSVNTASGVISGTPTVSGTANATVSATNAYGTGTRPLVITLADQSLPVISSAATASGKQGQPFSYRVTASEDPVSYGATGLPAGVAVNPTTGVISGSPTVNGSFTVALSATNLTGTGSKTLTITVTSSVPVISSAATASGKQGQAFSYTITASESPMTFGAEGLPSGLSVNPSTGDITGTPTVSGTFTVTLAAANQWGTGTKALSITLASAMPAITSALTANATENESFSYQITASNTPTSFGATGLPLGLALNPTTGLISGTMMYGGTFDVSLQASNQWGTGTAVLRITGEYAVPAELWVHDLRWTYSSPYLLDFTFSLRDGDDPTASQAVVRPTSHFTVWPWEGEDELDLFEADAILAPGNKKQLRCYVVLDYTLSMTADPDDPYAPITGKSEAILSMERAAKNFIERLPQEALVGVCEFHGRSDPAIVANFTTDKQALCAAIDGPNGIWTRYDIVNTTNTSRCWDAIKAATEQFASFTVDPQAESDENRYMAFISDGKGNASKYATVTTAGDGAETKGIRVYCIGYGSSINTGNLNALATKTKGRTYVAADPEELEEQFLQIGKDIDGQYVLRWATPRRLESFEPWFAINLNGFEDLNGFSDDSGSRLPAYTPSQYAGDDLEGLLRLVASAGVDAKSVLLRCSYAPVVQMRRIRIHYRANHACVPVALSTATGEILEGWTLTQTSDGAGGWWLELNGTRRMPFAAMGGLVRFDFATPLANPQDAFALLEVDNTIYPISMGGVHWTIGNRSQFLTTYPALAVTTASPLPGATVGTAYSRVFAATGATLPYRWEIVSGSAPGLSLSTAGVLSGMPTMAGTASFTVQVTGDDGQTASRSFTLQVAAAAGFAEWKASRFTVAELGQPSISGDNADPDHDGIPNLLEYAFSLQPKTTDVAGLSVAATTGGHLTFTYRQSKSATDLTFTPQSATDLTLGPWSAAGFTETARADMGDHWLVTVRHDAPISGTLSRFVRLQVVR